jgi:hypothetical protein
MWKTALQLFGLEQVETRPYSLTGAQTIRSAPLLREQGLNHFHHGALPGLGQRADALQVLLDLRSGPPLAGTRRWPVS